MIHVALLLALAFPPADAAVIVGPTASPNGKLVVLSTDVSKAKKVRWYVLNPPEDDNHQVAPDSSRLYFSTSFAGDYDFELVLIVTNEKDEDDIVREVHTLRVAAYPIPIPPVVPPQPPPVPPPVQPPAPQPVPPPAPTPIPPTPSSLAAWVTVTASGLIPPGSSRRIVTTALSTSYRTWAKNAINNGVTDPVEFAKGQDVLNKITLAQLHVAVSSAALDAFFKALANQLASMGLTTIPQHVQAWNDIADGLARVP